VDTWCHILYLVVGACHVFDCNHRARCFIYSATAFYPIRTRLIPNGTQVSKAL
jgi:hypothetical protein